MAVSKSLTWELDLQGHQREEGEVRQNVLEKGARIELGPDTVSLEHGGYGHLHSQT